MRFKLIVVTVKKDLTEKVIDTAKEAGATGATIIPARGIGGEDRKTFFGLTIEGPTDVVLFLVEEHCVRRIFEAFEKHCNIREPGVGMALTLPVDEVVGIADQIDKFKDQARDQYL